MTKPTRRSKTAVTRAELCEAIYKKVGLSRSESARLVELVLEEITNCLEHGETVKLSSFGSFVVRSKGARMGRNPKTGEAVPMKPRRVMARSNRPRFSGSASARRMGQSSEQIGGVIIERAGRHRAWVDSAHVRRRL